MLSRQDQISGAVLLRLLREGAARHVSAPGDHPGHFILDRARHVLIKKATRSQGHFCFTFSRSAIEHLLSCREDGGMFSTYILLVGDGSFVCELPPEEWLRLLDVDAPPLSQTVRVVSRPNCSLRVSGPKGRLDRTVPKNRFPSFGHRGLS